MSNNKGFTLIELLVSLALIVVIMVPGFSLLKNVLNYEDKHNDIALLNQDIQIIENMVDTYLKQSDNIDSIYSSEITGNRLTDTSDVLLKNMILNGKFDSDNSIRITVKENTLSIELGNIVDGEFSIETSIESGSYVSELVVTPLPLGADFENATGLELNYILEKGNQKKESRNRYYFRN